MMERMGHSSITVTLDRYGHVLPSLEKHLTNALDVSGRAAQQVFAQQVVAHDLVPSRE